MLKPYKNIRWLCHRHRHDQIVTFSRPNRVLSLISQATSSRASHVDSLQHEYPHEWFFTISRPFGSIYQVQLTKKLHQNASNTPYLSVHSAISSRENSAEWQPGWVWEFPAGHPVGWWNRRCHRGCRGFLLPKPATGNLINRYNL